jgi:beta-phosphoglucomutase-like phosphatase (HAD superfamily)
MAGSFAAAVFDLDGTLIDSEERSREAWLHVFKARGLPADEELIRSFVGRRGVDTRDLLLARLPDHDPAELMAATHGYFHGPDQPPLEPMPGAARLVRSIAAADVPLGLVTSAGRRYAEESLVDLGVRELFTVVVTAEDVTAG